VKQLRPGGANSKDICATIARLIRGEVNVHEGADCWLRQVQTYVELVGTLVEAFNTTSLTGARHTLDNRDSLFAVAEKLAT